MLDILHRANEIPGDAAHQIQISQLFPLAVTVLIAASAAFSTPVSTSVVTLGVAPGDYSFSDFLKVGLPLSFLTGVVTVLVTPIVIPLKVQLLTGDSDRLDAL